MMPLSPSLPAKIPPRLWLIYMLTRRADGRSYVGVTSRTLQARVEAHESSALHRLRLGGPGSLAEAIRQAHRAGQSVCEAFDREILGRTCSDEEARRLERLWVERTGCRFPNGFNRMPGGSSLGGPANSKPVDIAHPSRGLLHYPSLMRAVDDCNLERRQRRQTPLELGLVYARLEMGWPVEEALELAVHADGRSQRAPFHWDGQSRTSLAEIAGREGIPVATLRSRLHRARRAGCTRWYDAALDRRTLAKGLLTRLQLPHPLDECADPVDAKTFARLTGVPKASVLHRYHQLVEPQETGSLTREQILAALTERQDRRVLISLRLPDGQVLTGGVREVIRQVLDGPFAGRRPERLSFSAIRARLRRCTGWPRAVSPEGMQWAFGFAPADTGASHVG